MPNNTILRNTVVVSISTGRHYEIDAKGIATEVQPYDEIESGCECEMDWNCPNHGGTDRPTWIELRYSESF